MDQAKQADPVDAQPVKGGGLLQNKAALAVAAVLALGGDNVAIYIAGHDSGKQDAFTEIVTSDSTAQAQSVDVAAIVPGSAASKMIVLEDTTLKQEQRDSLLRVAFVKDSIANSNHDTVLQIPPQTLPKVQIPAGMIATVSVIVSDPDGGNPVVMQSKKLAVDQADPNLCTDIYAGFYIAQNQPIDKP
jgi:hypothetical protein